MLQYKLKTTSKVVERQKMVIHCVPIIWREPHKHENDIIPPISRGITRKKMKTIGITSYASAADREIL